MLCLITGCKNKRSDDALFFDYFPGRPIEYMQTSGYVVGAYISSGAIEEGYEINEFPSGNLSHLLYAFLTICGQGQTAADAAECESKQDYTLTYNSQALDDIFIPQLAEFKRASPQLKVLASFGGAEGSNPFFT